MMVVGFEQMALCLASSLWYAHKIPDSRPDPVWSLADTVPDRSRFVSMRRCTWASKGDELSKTGHDARLFSALTTMSLAVSLMSAKGGLHARDFPAKALEEVEEDVSSGVVRPRNPRA